MGNRSARTYVRLRTEAKPRPVLVLQEAKAANPDQARVDNYERLRERPELCPLCGQKTVGIHPDGFFKTLCNQCGAVNGVLPLLLFLMARSGFEVTDGGPIGITPAGAGYAFKPELPAGG